MTETDLNETDNLADSGTHHLNFPIERDSRTISNSALDPCLRVPGSPFEGFNLNNDFWFYE